MIRTTACLLGFFLAASAVSHGQLNPPPGPVGGSFKNLNQLSAATDVSTLPGRLGVKHIISQPGCYKLTGNIVAGSSEIGILVNSPGVKIDLGGFKLRAQEGSNEPGIKIDTGAMNGAPVTIQNGFVSSFDMGVSDFGADPQSGTVIIRGVAFTDNARSGVGLLTLPAKIDRASAEGNGGSGFSLAAGSLVRDSTVLGNGAFGMFLRSNSQVLRSRAVRNGLTGVAFPEGEAVLMKGVVSESNSQSGVSFSEGTAMTFALFIENTVTGSNSRGLDLDGFVRARMQENTVEGNGEEGVRVGADAQATVKENSVRGNGGPGVELASSNNRVTGNHVKDNGDNAPVIPGGVRLSAGGNVVDGNKFESNGTVAAIDLQGVDNIVVKNVFTDEIAPTSGAVAGNKVGATLADPTVALPWDNFGQ